MTRICWKLVLLCAALLITSNGVQAQDDLDSRKAFLEHSVRGKNPRELTPTILIDLVRKLTDPKVGDAAKIRAADGGAVMAALIGADGLRSRVREGLGLTTPDGPRYSGRTSWRALIPASAVPAELLQARGSLWLGPGAHLVLYPLRNASVLNAVAIVQDEWTDLDAPDFWSSHGDAAFLASRFQGWTREARELIGVAPEWRRWPLYTRAPVERWSVGRVTVLGDAAHAMAPFLAQGAAQAIDMAKSILLDCATEVPTTVTVDTTAITPENAKSLMTN